MTDQVDFDLHEITQFADHLDGASKEVVKQLRAVLSRGALNIKTDSRRRVRGLAHARAYPNSINYEIRNGPLGPYAEVGPDKDRKQGALGNILEFGTVNNPAHPHMRPAADAEEPRFAKAIEELATQALERR
jgi:hypothetical protein